MSTDKPKTLAPLLDAIPAELRAIPRWICWKHQFATQRRRWIKLPIDPKDPKRAAKINDPSTWSDYETAAAAYEFIGGVDGVGFVFGDDGIIGIDFDKCLDPATGELSDAASAALESIPGYWEVSPSGKGLHCITRAQIEKAYKDDKQGIELYKNARYFTITGHLFNVMADIPAAAVDLSQFIAKHFPPKTKEAPHAQLNQNTASDNNGTVAAPIEKKGGDFFKRVNDHAMRNLSAWVPVLFPQADTYQDGYRITSESLGRDLEESISIVSKGIVDFGVADMGDARDGKRTPIDLVMEWYETGDVLAPLDPRGAAMWLCDTLKVKPEALGWENQSVVPGAGELPFAYNDNGRIVASVTNLALALQTPAFCGVRIGHDQFRDEIMLAPKGTDAWRAFTDADYVRLRMWLESCGFAEIGREKMRDVVGLAADEHKFDSAILWLNSLTWDGTARVEAFLSRYFNVDHTEYVRAVSTYIWTALAGRVLEPGCKADMVPILVGPQGLKKSSAIEAMVPSRDHFVEIQLDAKEEDQARKMRGRLIGEIAELRGLHSRDIESIKAFITRTHETWVPKYREFAVNFPRRCIFLGTNNPQEFLSDDTGNRRWLPVKVGEVIDIAAIRNDRAQLWAEARELFLIEGVAFERAERLAPTAHAAHVISDVWEDEFTKWLDEADDFEVDGAAPRRERPVLLSALLKGALRMDIKHIGRKDEMRAGRVLRAMGFEKRVVRVGGKLHKAWCAAGVET